MVIAGAFERTITRVHRDVVCNGGMVVLEPDGGPLIAEKEFVYWPGEEIDVPLSERIVQGDQNSREVKVVAVALCERYCGAGCGYATTKRADGRVMITIYEGS